MPNPKTRKILLFISFAVVLLVSVFISGKADPALTQDLGRHLKLGGIIWQTKTVPATNLFSYTSPSFPFINHHWLSEVIFYLTDALGASALILLKIAFISLALALAFYSAYRLAGLLPALVSFLFLAPLIIDRAEVRPEIIPFFLFALIFYLLFIGKNRKLIWLAPLIIAFWVNLHISFVFGLFLIGVYFLKKIIKALTAKPRQSIACPGLFLLANLGAALLNPNGLIGALYPFLVFRNYGYLIVENQSLFFLLPRIDNPFLVYFLILAPVVILALAAGFALQKRRARWELYLIAFTFLALSVYMVRHIPFFVLSAVPVLALALEELLKKLKFLSKPEFYFTALAAVLAAGLALAVMVASLWRFSLRLPDPYRAGVDFFISRQLPGQIFNNFDVGSYLDYRLYPSYRVFVDNRPEAYSEVFFELYRRLQDNPRLRKKIFSAFNINSVIFAYNDLTPWAQNFLYQITKDPEWEIRYLDPFLIILTRKS